MAKFRVCGHIHTTFAIEIDAADQDEAIAQAEEMGIGELEANGDVDRYTIEALDAIRIRSRNGGK